MDIDKETLLRLVFGYMINQMEIFNFYEKKRNQRNKAFLRKLLRKLQESTFKNNNNELLQVILSETLLVKEPRRFWKKPRSDHWYRNIFKSYSAEELIENFRIDRSTFREIVNKLSTDLSPHPAHIRESITAEKKCAIAIYKLASCAEYRIIGNQFGVHKSTVKKCIYQFCEAMIKCYLDTEIYMPQGEETNEVIRAFESKSKVPHIIGAIDGTHIPITPKAEGYRDFINRKQWPSLVMQAVVDSKYQFRDVVCKHPGCTHDAAVLKDSGLYRHYSDLQLPSILINGQNVKPVIVGDPAYPLLPWLLKGYASPRTAEEESLNVYLSKARIVVENAFGRLKSRWRILQKKIDVNVDFVPKLVLTCCILHNIVEKKNRYISKSWQNELEEANKIYPQPESNHERLSYATIDGEHARDFLKDYMAAKYPLLRSNYM